MGGKDGKDKTNRIINPFTPKVKSWVIESFLTFDFMDRTPDMERFYR